MSNPTEAPESTPAVCEHLYAEHSSRYDMRCVHCGQSTLEAHDSDALMLLVWEGWAGQQGNDGAAKLFRRVYTRLRDERDRTAKASLNSLTAQSKLIAERDALLSRLGALGQDAERLDAYVQREFVVGCYQSDDSGKTMWYVVVPETDVYYSAGDLREALDAAIDASRTPSDGEAANG